MKKYKLHWTYEVVSVPVDSDWENEVFLTFHPEPQDHSRILALSESQIQEWFLPELYEYAKEHGVEDRPTPKDLIQQLDDVGRVEDIICQMLNEGVNDYCDLTSPLEKNAYLEWKKVSKID